MVALADLEAECKAEIADLVTLLSDEKPAVSSVLALPIRPTNEASLDVLRQELDNVSVLDVARAQFSDPALAAAVAEWREMAACAP